MKFLVDAQLPVRLAVFLQYAGYDAIHTKDLYQFEKRMLRIVRAIKRLYMRCPFDKKDNLRPKKWY
ncbi:MAG: hypothetical protein F6K54_18610 [Okeania sp. SIO3B5]|uniref:hypothetical protein n=1 Tax=Okeania sp. SIO3B5 TaxID=2607811 RepID=UPI001401574D|nr:hypothetical protein [Okeania sp. SIO3B5]NEO54909.1 hypothetical protein [Okeania sp. SIO3B5]